jgi:cytochrome c oxidase subunit 2
MRRDYVTVGILWFVLTFLGILLAPITFSFYFPPPGAEEAVFIDNAFRYLVILAIPVFSFVVSVLVYSMIRFRVQDDSNEEGPPVKSSATVYLTWLLITSGLAIAILIHPGVTGIAELRSNPAADLVVQVSAEQWNWTYTYPEYGVTIEKAKELVLPVDTRVKFEITGTDVLHSFWVPAFRMKIDAVPGKVTTLYVTPTVVGAFDDDPNMRVQCAEICGTGHARMRTQVVVVEPDEFEEWLAESAQARITE